MITKIINRNRFLGVFLILPFLASCGGKNDNKNLNSLSGSEYVVVDAGNLTFGAESISGSGSIVFNSPLSEIGSKNSYRLTLTIEDGGTITLVSNATNRLEGGVGVNFARSGETLNVSIVAGGGATDVSTKFVGVKASDPLTFQVDVHNDESPAHLLMWDGNISSFTQENARLNSEEAGLESPGKGTGTFWGVVLKKATVTQAALSGPKFIE